MSTTVIPIIDPNNKDHLRIGRHDMMNIGCYVDDLRYLMLISGKWGSGKSELLLNIIHQLESKQHGAVVIDCKGSALIDQALAHIPLEREADVLILDPRGYSLNGEHMQIGLGLMADSSSISYKIRGWTNVLKKMGVALSNDQWQVVFVSMEWYLGRMSRTTTLGECIQYLATTPLMESPTITSFVEQSTNLLNNELYAYSFNTSQPTVDLYEALNANKLIFAPLYSIPEGTSAYAPLLYALHDAILSRSNVEECYRVPTTVVVDEAQVLGNTFPELMEEMVTMYRALKVGQIYACCSTRAFQHAPFAQVLESNAQIHAVLQLSTDDAKWYQDLLFRDSGIDVGSLRQHNHIAFRHLRHKPFVADMLPLLVQPHTVGTAKGSENCEWQTIRAGSTEETVEADAIIASVQNLPDAEKIAYLSELPTMHLMKYWQRTQQHRDAQRSYILEHPSCIPDKVTRILTLNALKHMRPITDLKAFHIHTKARVKIQTDTTIAMRADYTWVRPHVFSPTFSEELGQALQQEI